MTALAGVRGRKTGSLISVREQSSFSGDAMVFVCLYLETNKRDLHGQDGAQAVDCAVSHIYTVGETACEHQHQDMKGYKVDQEHVATPRRNLNTQMSRSHLNSEFLQVKRAHPQLPYHVKVCQGADGGPIHGAGFNSFNPHVIGQQHAEDSNT